MYLFIEAEIAQESCMGRATDEQKAAGLEKSHNSYAQDSQQLV